MADEQIRVGAILQDIFSVAMDVDWKTQKVRRLPSPLPPVAISASNLPLVERLLVKQVGSDDDQDLDLTVNSDDPEEMDEEFWTAWQALDREALFESTIAHLKESSKTLTLGELAKALPPTHDLETLTFWLAMAREAGVEIIDERETIDLVNEEDEITRFDTPLVRMNHDLTRSADFGPPSKISVERATRVDGFGEQG